MKKIYLTLLLTLRLQAQAPTPNSISLFFQDYPTTQTLQDPDNLPASKKSGNYISYFGYLVASDHSGQVLFPRKHSKPSFTLAITTQALPVFMLSNTINHWQIHAGDHCAVYTIEREHNTQTNTYYWNVKKAEAPKKGFLPLESVIIFAQPDQIYVPEGISLITKSSQLILPPLFVKDTVDRAKNALTVLEIRNFFNPLTFDIKTNKTDTQTRME